MRMDPEFTITVKAFFKRVWGEGHTEVTPNVQVERPTPFVLRAVLILVRLGLTSDRYDC